MNMQQAVDRFSMAVKRAIDAAQNEARAHRAKYINSAYMLLALLHEEGNQADLILKKLNVDELNLNFELICVIEDGIKQSGLPSFTSDVAKIWQNALEEAQRLGHSYVGTGHLLLGMLMRPDSPGTVILNGLGVTLERARAAVQELQATEN